MSPASANYLYKMEYKKSAFAASLVDMAVKGAITINLDKKGFFKNKFSLGDKKNTEQLRHEEHQMYAALFAGNETIKIDNKNYKKFMNADDKLQNELTKQWTLKNYFVDSRKQNIIGGLIVFLLIALNVFVTGFDKKNLFTLMLVSPFMSISLIRLIGFVSAGCCAGAIALKFIGLTLFASIIILIAVLADADVEISWLSAALFTLLSIVYWIDIVIPTSEGAKIASELNGFRMYMKTAEEHRLNILTPPDRTPELFEKLLPYAIALGVSNQWCKKFNNVLKQVDYHPEWYTGSDISTVGVVSTFVALGTSFSSSVGSAKKDTSAYSTSSSSGSRNWSSGSSGGGYSGGGGGGGGGRGW
jgi:uncharacterized membrane protein YgcG